MQKEQIFEILKSNVLATIPDVTEEQLQIEQSLTSLGANSLDRADIIIQTMQQLKLKIDLVEFGKAKNMEGLVDIFHQKLTSSST